jgi:hypothetical protein
MTSQPAQQLAHLRSLAALLPDHGLTAELRGTRTASPHLHAARPDDAALQERINCRPASATDGTWQFCWPKGQPIGPADDPAAAAAIIAGVLRPVEGTT